MLAGPGSLTKLGSGMLTLNGADTFAGLTTVEAGILAGPSAQNAVLTLGGADVRGGQLVFDYSGTSPASIIESILAESYAGHFAAGSAPIYCSTAAANGWGRVGPITARAPSWSCRRCRATPLWADEWTSTT